MGAPLVSFSATLERGPFRAEMPAYSNGFLCVLAANGEEIAICFENGARYAAMIAAALNAAAEQIRGTVEEGKPADLGTALDRDLNPFG